MAMRGTVEEPEGFRYQPDLITPEEERKLLGWIQGLDLHEVVMHGQASRRVVRSYGVGYDFETRELRESEPIPAELLPLEARAEAFAGLASGTLVEALVTKYPRGATIGWHRDARAFGEQVVGLSLGAPAVLARSGGCLSGL
jgi:DNA oxidative demethylase